MATNWLAKNSQKHLESSGKCFLCHSFCFGSFFLAAKVILVKHQSAGQEDILGQETYSNVYKIGARNLNIFIFEHEVKQ